MSRFANLLICSSISDQTLEKMVCQAVIRNSNDALVSNTTVGMQISILQGSASGSVVHTETQTPTTNANSWVFTIIRRTRYFVTKPLSCK